MPWCPKCKSEYRDGFTVCADCGSQLVEESELKKMEAAKRVQIQEPEYYEFPNEAEAVEETQSEESEQAVRQMQEAAMARKLYYGAGGSRRYEDSSERASDNRSSAWMLLIMGTLGIIVLILAITGVIPLRLGNSYLFYGVLAALFILFIVAGLVSMKNAKFFEKKAESENSLRDTVLEWCKENLKADEIDRQIGATKDTPEEMLYFRRFAFIKFRLNHQFMNLDQGFVDKFIDDYVYDSVFEENEEV